MTHPTGDSPGRPGEGDGRGARGLNQLSSGSFDAAAAMGGVRGLIESVLPGLVFLIAYIASERIGLAVVLAVAAALIATVARLVNRTPITQAVGGLAGIIIGALWAWRSGEATDFFAWGLWVNAAFATAMIISVVARYPAVGVLAAGLTGRDLKWRDAPDPRLARRRFTRATWLWAAAFLARLAVQLPLYFNGAVGWLGTARLVMGLPMWVLVLWVTWVMVSPFVRRETADAEAPSVDRPGPN